MDYLPALYADPAIEDKDASQEDLSIRMNQRMETLIRKAPEQWAWMHQRWRTNPENLALHRARKAAERAHS